MRKPSIMYLQSILSKVTVTNYDLWTFDPANLKSLAHIVWRSEPKCTLHIACTKVSKHNETLLLWIQVPSAHCTCKGCDHVGMRISCMYVHVKLEVGYGNWTSWSMCKSICQEWHKVVILAQVLVTIRAASSALHKLVIAKVSWHSQLIRLKSFVTIMY